MENNPDLQQPRRIIPTTDGWLTYRTMDEQARYDEMLSEREGERG